jgi:formamidopyrimidine-DNA glycosylase
MPELPEVETVRTIARSLVLGRRIQEIRLDDRFPDVLQGSDGIDAIATLIGQRIREVHRRGKFLLFELDDGIWMIIHLRMTGRLLVQERQAPPIRFEHLALELDNDMDIRFGDQRKFGRVTVVTRDVVDALDARLGVEPLENQLTGAWLHRQLARRPGKIKAVLLDQHLIAGLGNIYVDEALFRARIHPRTSARTLSQAECSRLVRSIRHVLRQALGNQGTTFSTFENPYGESGSNAAFLQVYGKGRSHGTCPRCGQPLEFGIVGGRGTTWCDRCQPAPTDDSSITL